MTNVRLVSIITMNIRTSEKLACTLTRESHSTKKGQNELCLICFSNKFEELQHRSSLLNERKGHCPLQMTICVEAMLK